MKKKISITIACLIFAFSLKLAAQNWTINGNTLGATASFGSIDNKKINFISDNKVRGRLNNDGLWGFGTTDPFAQVHINTKDAAINPLQVDVLDVAKMIVNNNGGVSIGSSNIPPADGLFVSGKLGLGTNTPEVKLQVTGGSEVQLNSGGTIIVGTTTDQNLVMDRNEIQARNNGAANTFFLNKDGGDVNFNSGGLIFKSSTNRLGIGTTSPTVPLNVTGGFALSLNGGGDIVTGLTNGFNLGISNGAIQARNNGAGSLLSLNSDGGDVNISRGALFVESDNNFVGIGATPSAKFHVVIGTDATLTDGGYIVAGPTTSKNVVIDENEIMARDNSAASTLFLNNNGGDINMGGGDIIISGTTGHVGIQTPPLNNRTLQVGTGGDVLGIGNAETLEDFGNFTIATNSDFLTLTDDLASLGSSVRRWRQLWAIDGTINTSDERDKQNIRDLDYGLKEIMKLHSVKFNWKNSISSGDKLGLIAQDLQKVLPEVVRDYDYKRNEQTGKAEKIPSERLGVMYADIIPVLIRGMQQQQEMIQEQNKKIETLTQLVTQLTTNNRGINSTQSESKIKSNPIVSSALLEQNAPNPFSSNTVIRYTIPLHAKQASLIITSVNGQIIKTISINKKDAGQVIINANELSAGNYFYTLVIDGNKVDTKQMMLTK